MVRHGKKYGNLQDIDMLILQNKLLKNDKKFTKQKEKKKQTNKCSKHHLVENKITLLHI